MFKKQALLRHTVISQGFTTLSLSSMSGMLANQEQTAENHTLTMSSSDDRTCNKCTSNAPGNKRQTQLHSFWTSSVLVKCIQATLATTGRLTVSFCNFFGLSSKTFRTENNSCSRHSHLLISRRTMGTTPHN